MPTPLPTCCAVSVPTRAGAYENEYVSCPYCGKGVYWCGETWEPLAKHESHAPEDDQSERGHPSYTEVDR